MGKGLKNVSIIINPYKLRHKRLRGFNEKLKFEKCKKKKVLSHLSHLQNKIQYKCMYVCMFATGDAWTS